MNKSFVFAQEGAGSIISGWPSYYIACFLHQNQNQIKFSFLFHQRKSLIMNQHLKSNHGEQLFPSEFIKAGIQRRTLFTSGRLEAGLELRLKGREVWRVHDIRLDQVRGPSGSSFWVLANTQHNTTYTQKPPPNRIIIKFSPAGAYARANSRQASSPTNPVPEVLQTVIIIVIQRHGVRVSASFRPPFFCDARSRSVAPASGYAEFSQTHKSVN